MSTLSERVIKAVADILQVTRDKVDVEVGVGDLPEWDSLGHTRLIMGIEERFDIIIGVEDAIDLESVQDIVELIAEKHADSANE